MPDEQGKLLDQEIATFQKWLKAHWASSPICSVCQKNNWIIGEHLVTTTKISEKGDILLGGVTYPQVMLVCGNCAVTLSFNARLIGVVKDDPQEIEKG